MPSLADHLAALPRKSGGHCTVAAWLATLSDEDREQWEQALDLSSGWQHAQLFTVARDKFGWAKSLEPLSRHRRGDCLCRKT